MSGELSKGVSLALCQTEKGQELLDMMDFNFYDVDIDAAIIFVISLKQEVILKYEIKVDMEYLLTAGSAGEVDLLLKKDDKEVAIVEGLKLASVDKAYIKEHIDKAIVNYNPLGTSTFIIAYAGAADFAGLWNRLYSYLTSYEYPIEVKRELKELVQASAAIKCAEILLNKDAFVFPLYFLAVNIGR